MFVLLICSVSVNENAASLSFACSQSREETHSTLCSRYWSMLTLAIPTADSPPGGVSEWDGFIPNMGANQVGPIGKSNCSSHSWAHRGQHWGSFMLIYMKKLEFAQKHKASAVKNRFIRLICKKRLIKGLATLHNSFLNVLFNWLITKWLILGVQFASFCLSTLPSSSLRLRLRSHKMVTLGQLLQGGECWENHNLWTPADTEASTGIP